MKLLLVRHGETDGNVERRLQGPDDPLTERGRRQARELATHLAGRADIVALYASPLARAWETAGAIGGELGIDPVPRPGLAEIDIGDAAGLTFDEWAERHPDQAKRFGDDGLEFRWPGGESGRDVAVRTAAEIEDVLETHRRETGAVVLVSHGGALAWILSHLLGESDDKWPSDHMLLENCSVTEAFIPEDGRGAVAFVCRNDVGHLTPDPDAEAAVGDKDPG